MHSDILQGMEMIDIAITCLYCGKEWEDSVWSLETRYLVCSDCGEKKHIKVVEKCNKRVNYYKDCPEFPKEEPKIELEPYEPKKEEPVEDNLVPVVEEPPQETKELDLLKEFERMLNEGG